MICCMPEQYQTRSQGKFTKPENINGGFTVRNIQEEGKVVLLMRRLLSTFLANTIPKCIPYSLIINIT